GYLHPQPLPQHRPLAPRGVRAPARCRAAQARRGVRGRRFGGDELPERSRDGDGAVRDRTMNGGCTRWSVVVASWAALTVLASLPGCGGSGSSGFDPAFLEGLVIEQALDGR